MNDHPILRLFTELGRAETEKVSLSYVNEVTEWTTQQVQARFADALAESLTEKSLNVYMMVNPVVGVVKGRGDAQAVTALAALWADLDYKDNGLKGEAGAYEVIEMLSAIVNTPPTAIVSSGHGLQPYWALEGGNVNEMNRNFMAGLLKRWGYLVQRIAEVNGGKVDSVFDLPRVLRAPGTINFKGGGTAPTTITFPEGSHPLTIDEAVEAVEAYGFLNENLTVGEFIVVAPSEDWPPAKLDCVWAMQLFSELDRTDLKQKSRHGWLVGKATRLEVAARNGCLTEETYGKLVQLIESKFYEILDSGTEPRKPSPGEVTTAFRWARQLVSTFSDAKMADNLNYHTHRAALYAVPDLPKGLSLSSNVVEFPTDGNAALAPELVPITLGDEAFSYTGVANAERLANAIIGKYIFTPGLGWYFWAEGHYVRDEANSVIREAITSIRDFAQQDPRKGAMEWAVKYSMSAPAIASTVRLAESTPELVILPLHLDSTPLELCTPSGIVELEKGTLRQAEATRDYNTRQTAVSPSPGPMPLFEAFLDRVIIDQERIQYIQDLFGVALIGEVRWHVLPVLSGAGANGKSTLLDIAGRCLGSYSAIMPENFLMDGGRTEHSTEIARLRGVRLAIANETRPDAKFNESRVKILTAEPVLSARTMGKDFMDFKSTHTMFVSLNHPPTVRDGGDGFWRRVKMILFGYQIPEAEQDVTFAQRVFEAEGPQILNWMIEGAKRVLETGLVEPESVKIATSVYRSEEDHVNAWVVDICDLNPVAEFTALDIYRSYVGWCKVNNHEPLGTVQLFRDLRQRFPLTPTKIGTQRAWRGLYIFTDREDEQPWHR